MKLIYKFIPFLALILICEPVFAQEISKIDNIVETMRISVTSISGKLATIAKSLIMSLIVIEMVWSLGKAVVEGNDLAKYLIIIFKRIVIAGFFLFLIDGIPTFGGGNIGISSFIIDSAEALAGNTLDKASMKPSQVFFDFYNFGFNSHKDTGWFGKIGGGLIWLIMVVIGAIITALLITAYIEIHIIFTIGILALGFGAWSQTQSFATTFIFSAVGKIFKLFTIILMGSLIQQFVQNMGSSGGFAEGLMLIGTSVILVILMSTVPAAVEQVINGVPLPSSDSAVAGTVTNTATALPKMAAKQAGDAAAKVVGAAGGAVVRGTGRMMANTAKSAGSGFNKTLRKIMMGG